MNLSELLEQIKTKTTKNEAWNNPDFLSNLLLELASLYSTIGPLVADAERDADFAETHFKVTEAQATLENIENNQPVGRSELKAKVDSKQDREAHHVKQHKARLLFLTRQNLATTIDSVRSRLSYLKNDKEVSKHGV